MGITDLDLVQIGDESTWGTAVAQTSRLMSVEDARLLPSVTTKVYTQKGSLAPGNTAAAIGKSGAARIEQLALYEDILYPLESMFGKDTPSGAGPYTYEYAAPLNTAVTSPRFSTIAKGQGSDIWSLTGALCNMLVLRGEAGEQNAEVLMTHEYVGKEVAVDTLDSLSDRTVNPIMTAHAALYIDAWGGTIGTTAVSAVAWAFELNLDANRVLLPYLGDISPLNWSGRRMLPENNHLTLSMDFDSGGTTNAIVDEVLGLSAGSAAQRQIRLKFSNGANLDAQLDFAGTITEAPEISNDRDGVTTVDLKFHGTYNSGLANWFKATIINSLASVP